MASHESEPGKGEEYMFKRDYKSSIRLNYNHWTMRGTAGYLLHPSIPADKPDLRIADIGTGTGVWALELASTLPNTVRIDCFDESGQQYPHQGFHTDNLQFHVRDCFKSFPAEYLCQFDIVHIRFWLCIVNDPDFEPLFQNLLTLLSKYKNRNRNLLWSLTDNLFEPGGYLQWFEPLAWDSKVYSVNPDAPQAASEKIAKSWYEPKPDTSYNWVYDMQNCFVKAGMSDIVREVHTMPNWLRPQWMQGSLAGIEDMIAKIKVWNETAEATRKMMDDLEVEISLGVSVDTPFQCVVGRKP